MADDRCDLLCLDLPRAEELRAAGLPVESRERAASKARALAEPTRLQLVDSLHRGGELCVCDLAWISGRPQNLVSHHLRMLKSVGVARSRRDGKVVFYSLTKEGERLFRLVIGEVAASSAVEASA